MKFNGIGEKRWRELLIEGIEHGKRKKYVLSQEEVNELMYSGDDDPLEEEDEYDLYDSCWYILVNSKVFDMNLSSRNLDELYQEVKKVQLRDIEKEFMKHFDMSEDRLHCDMFRFIVDDLVLKIALESKEKK